MALCYVVLNVATTRKQESNQYFGLAIGFTVPSVWNASDETLQGTYVRDFLYM